MSTLLTQRGLDLSCQASTLPQICAPISSSFYNVRKSTLSCSLALPSIPISSIRGPGSKGKSARSRRSALSSKQETELSVIEHDRALAVLDEFKKACATPKEKLLKVVDAMVDEFTAGLASDGADLKMLPAFLENLPDGTEKGCFYALDLGGTNFRVIRAELGGRDGTCDRTLKQEFATYTIPKNLMLGESDDLFDFLVGKLRDFIALEQEIHHDAARKRELGFTFSFPVLQHSIASGTLIHWSKGFKVKGTVGKDVVTVLQEAIRRNGLDLEVTALVNDTVGTLAKGRYWNEDVMIGVILGTGTNCCYVENAEAVPKYQGAPPASGKHVINTEWGNFNSKSLPTTFADEEMDRDSVNPGEHIFEKLMSGLYLGEIVRRVILKISQEVAFFGAQSSGRLSRKDSLTTPDISRVHDDQSDTLEVAGEVLSKALGITSSSVEERRIFLSVIQTVTRRGARLAAVALVAILKKIGRVGGSNGNGKMRKTVVAMDGGLYEHYSQFRAYMIEGLEELLGKEVASRVAIELSKDGSGIGAALLAASHSRYRSH